jgi:hypothetical protein
MSARDLAVQGITVAIDPRGEATVAWVDEPDDNGLLHGHKTVRAAFRTSEGHWSAVQSIGRSGAFFYASPRLAATSDGTVALTYNAGVFGPSHVMSAWRSRGHRFGSLRPIAASSGLMDPNLAVDSGGVVYLVGTRNCDRSTSAGVLYTATARGRRFGTARVIAPGPAAHVQLSVLGRGSAVVAWLARSCNTTEDLTGAPMTAALRGATVTPPVRLDFAPATGITLAGAPRGADVSWTAFPINAPGGALLSSHVSAAGVPTVAQSPVDQWIAVAADSRGDQVMRRVSSPATTPLSPLAVRGATGAFELAPITGAGWPWTAGTTGAADGAALAAMTSASRRIVATVWRPTHP